MMEDVQEALSDQVLVEQARRDLEAFGELYNRYVSRIYSYVYYRTGSRLEAEDLTEKVFLQAMQHLPRYKERGLPFSAWLFRIAHNLVANWHRDSGRRKTFRLEEVRLEEDSTLELERREELTLLRRAVIALPPRRQQLILLRFVDGMSNAEIGHVIGCSEGAVKVLLHRTMKSLQASLEVAKDGKG